MCIDKDINYTNKEKILELFNFYEEEIYTNTDENRKLMKDILNIEKSFYDSLTDNQKKQFEDLMDLKGLNVGVTDGRIFTFAFSLAVRLILESKI
ncbi:MAG: hypothetical protein IKE01_04155 [Clostridia bacterium]|nr:hypothetical protein [Clostridia bacterium]